MIRCGYCSVCRVSMESPDGSVNNARPRARHLRNHHHKKPWHVVADASYNDRDRDWHDVVPWFVR